MFRSDEQRRAMFASMGNDFSRARTATPIKEDFALVGRALAYRGDVDVAGDQAYEIFVPNIFAQTVEQLEDLSRYRGTDLAKVAEDVLRLRREQSKPIPEQEFVDVSTLPSLEEIGMDKAFKHEVFESVSEGLPEGYEFEDWDDVISYQKIASERAADWKPPEIQEPEIIIKEKIIREEVPTEVSITDGYGVPVVEGGEVQVLDESAGVYQYNYPGTVVMEPQEVRKLETFDRFFGTPTVRRLEKKLGEFEDEL